MRDGVDETVLTLSRCSDTVIAASLLLSGSGSGGTALRRTELLRRTREPFLGKWDSCVRSLIDRETVVMERKSTVASSEGVGS